MYGKRIGSVMGSVSTVPLRNPPGSWRQAQATALLSPGLKTSACILVAPDKKALYGKGEGSCTCMWICCRLIVGKEHVRVWSRSGRHLEELLILWLLTELLFWGYSQSCLSGGYSQSCA